MTTYSSFSYTIHNMISYKHRFHGYNALRYVSKNGTSIRSQYMSLKYIHNPKRPSIRVAVVVSKKVCKSSVGRNRIRRRIYEQVRLLLDSIKPHNDIVLYVGSSVVRTMPIQELTDTISMLLKEAGICQNELQNGMIDQKKE